MTRQKVDILTISHCSTKLLITHHNVYINPKFPFNFNCYKAHT